LCILLSEGVFSSCGFNVFFSVHFLQAANVLMGMKFFALSGVCGEEERWGKEWEDFVFSARVL
jgi:hypothetical protein